MYLFVNDTIYIYIYIYILSSTDRHFRCNTTLQCGQTRRTLQVGIETRLIYVRLRIIPLSHQSTYVSSGIIMGYVVAFVCLHFALPGTRVLNSFEELCITRVAAVDSFTRVLNPHGGGERIYCHPLTDCGVVSQLFTVARHVGVFKLGLKPAQLYVKLSIIYIYIYIYIRSKVDDRSPVNIYI